MNVPVMIQMKTTMMEMLTLSNSADVNRPQIPREILLGFPQGLGEEENDFKKRFNDTSGARQIGSYLLLRRWLVWTLRNRPDSQQVRLLLLHTSKFYLDNSEGCCCA
jgi:hypothetical protein